MVRIFQTSKRAQKIETSQPPLDLSPVGAKMSDTWILATESSGSKGKAQNDYVPEDPYSDSNLSDS